MSSPLPRPATTSHYAGRDWAGERRWSEGDWRTPSPLAPLPHAIFLSLGPRRCRRGAEGSRPPASQVAPAAQSQPAAQPRGAFTRLALACVAGWLLLLLPTAARAQTSIQKECIAIVERANRLKAQKKIDEAIAEYERAAEMAPRAFGPEAASTGNTYHNLAELYESIGRLDKALVLHERNLHIREVRWGDDSPEAYAVRTNLAIRYKQLGQFAKAEPLYKKNLEFTEEKYGPDGFEHGKTLNNYGLLLEALGKYDQVENYLQKSLAIYIREKGKDDPEVAIPLGNLAEMHRFFGNYKKAVEFSRRALALREKLGPEHEDVALSLNNLAALLRETGQNEQAGEMMRRAIRIWEKALGPRDPRLAIALNNLATDLMKVGATEEAQQLLERTLAVHRAAGPANPEVALAQHNLGVLAMDRGEPKRAEQYFRAALKLREKTLGPTSPDVGKTLANLVAALQAQERFEAALHEAERALSIYEKIYPPEHPEIDGIVGRIANLHENLGRLNEAAPLWKRSIDGYRKYYGDSHAGTAEAWRRLAGNLAMRGAWAEAVDDMDHACRGQLAAVRGMLAGLSEPEQLSYLQLHYALSFDWAMSLARIRAGNSDDARSAEWLLNGKALSGEVLGERALLSRDAQSALAGPKVRTLLAVRKQIADAAYASGAATLEKDKLDELIRKEQELSREIASAVARPAGSIWIDLASVRKAIPTDAVLVEIARFNLYDYRKSLAERFKDAKRGYAEFAAWIIPPQGNGNVRLVPLGNAKAIEAAVVAARNDIKNAPARSREVGEVQAEKEARKSLQRLADLVYQPLAKELAAAKHWILSPDAELWLAPWCALPVDAEHYAVEEHVIQYVVSSRDLVRKPPAVLQNPALILANPDYDLERDAARKQIAKLVKAPAAETRGIVPGIKLPRVPQLPATAAEADAVAPRLQALTKTPPKVYLEDQALEEVFKAARQPRIAMLSTHGFFLEDVRLLTPNLPVDVSTRKTAAKLLDNPLLRCGLLLAGCNRRDGKRNADEDDGVLTGLEILGIDLRGTELVVLSACETGLGVVHNGEGVAGLRQAFQLAGAQSVLATLWSVPDLPSAQLMVEFFGELADGKDRSAALQGAMKEMIRARREANAAAHPYFWAAFTMTGK